VVAPVAAGRLSKPHIWPVAAFKGRRPLSVAEKRKSRQRASVWLRLSRSSPGENAGDRRGKEKSRRRLTGGQLPVNGAAAEAAHAPPEAEATP
jgi:hypothetical protein